MVYLRYLIMANKPRIRFRGFTEDWEQRKLGDVADVRDGTHDSPKFYNDGFPLVTSKNLKDGSIDFSDCSFISKQDFDEINKRSKVDSGDILFGMIGTIGNPAIVEHTGFAIKNVALIKEGIIVNNRFIYHLLSSKVFDNYIARENAGGTQKFIALNQIRNFIFLAPTLEEQNKIIELLDYISQTITLHQCKLKKLNLAKKSLLQKLFPRNGSQIPGVRFKGFTDAWEQRNLGNLAEIVRGASPRPISDSKWFDNNSDVGWLRISDVTAQDGRIQYLEQKISKLGQDKTRVVKTPHLLLSIAATVGKPVINYVSTGVHDGFLIFLNPKFNILYAFWWLEMFREEWNKYGQPGSQVNLNSDLVKNQVINIPNEKEQEKISSFLEALDRIITLHQRKLERLQEVKKGLLQKMFV